MNTLNKPKGMINMSETKHTGQYIPCVWCGNNTGKATISDDGAYRCDPCREHLENVYIG